MKQKIKANKVIYSDEYEKKIEINENKPFISFVKSIELINSFDLNNLTKNNALKIIHYIQDMISPKIFKRLREIVNMNGRVLFYFETFGYDIRIEVGKYKYAKLAFGYHLLYRNVSYMIDNRVSDRLVLLEYLLNPLKKENVYIDYEQPVICLNLNNPYLKRLKHEFLDFDELYDYIEIPFGIGTTLINNEKK